MSDWLKTPNDVVKILEGAPFIWGFGGGWAIDMFLGHPTREHKDVDVVVLRKDIPIIWDFLQNFDLEAVVRSGELLAHAQPKDIRPEVFNVWVQDTKTKKWLFEILIENTLDDRWLYRRNQEITRPLRSIYKPLDSQLVLVPEIVLLYKSTSHRPEDEIDFRRTLLMLGPEGKNWLKNALQLTTPEHRWLRELLKSID